MGVTNGVCYVGSTQMDNSKEESIKEECGKDVLKFLFTISLHRCTITSQHEWAPGDLQISWKRGERRKSFEMFKKREGNRINEREEETHVDFDVDFVENSTRSMLVTLFKGENGYESKEYVFILEEVNGPIFKRLALFTFNIAEYVSMNYESFPLNIKFKSLSQKICHVSLDASIRCEFLKDGTDRDSDMMSDFSHVSDSDSEEMGEEMGEVNKDVAVLQSRAYKTRTQYCNDLDQKKTELSALHENFISFGAVPAVKEEVMKRLTSLAMTFNKKKEKDDVKEIQEIIHQVHDDDIVVNKGLQVQKLKLENEALHVKNAHLLSLVDTYKADVHDLQSEVSELHVLVHDLRLKLKQAVEIKNSSSTTSLSSLAKEQFNGWLCKQGVKGGPLGRRFKRRWFCLEDRLLYYYKYPGREQPQGFIDLEKVVGVEDLGDDTQDKNNGSFNVMTTGRVYKLTSHDEQDKQRWINMLDNFCSSTSRHALQAKKGKHEETEQR